MREIKFRAWVTEINKMFYWGFDIGNGAWFTGPPSPIHAIQMQYTGLLDKNGKEIYQGDIIKSSKWIAQVIYGNYGWTITPNKTSQRNEVVLFNLCSVLEVIGNIYENPELLK